MQPLKNNPYRRDTGCSGLEEWIGDTPVLLVRREKHQTVLMFLLVRKTIYALVVNLVAAMWQNVCFVQFLDRAVHVFHEQNAKLFT